MDVLHRISVDDVRSPIRRGIVDDHDFASRLREVTTEYRRQASLDRSLTVANRDDDRYQGRRHPGGAVPVKPGDLRVDGINAQLTEPPFSGTADVFPIGTARITPLPSCGDPARVHGRGQIERFVRVHACASGIEQGTTELGPIVVVSTVLAPKTIELMTSDHLAGIAHGPVYYAGEGYTWGLRLAVREDRGGAPMAGSAGDYFWPGAYATYWWADPKEQLVVVSMMQSPLGGHYAQLVRALVYQAIVK